MARRIRLLDEGTVNKIAAGEVVERPASVVKELVENALDAGAGRIEVDLRGGGIEQVVVADDGCGMSPEDASLAVQRHATSKIASALDLESVATLGFRGEALAAIAAVSRLELVTREAGALAGTRLVVRGGRVEESGETGCPAGTRVTVSELYYNTPARRKHLKSAAVELDRCGAVLTALALARPEVAFRARHNGREFLSTGGQGDMRATILSLYGAELAQQLLPVAGRAGGASLSGYVAPPALARGSRNHQYFIVNGRSVTGYPMAQALEEAFRGLLPLHRFPVAFLVLTVDPRRVDVNVHPAKLRVRFQDDGAIWRLVHDAVRAALNRAPLVPAARLGGGGDGGQAGAGSPWQEAVVREAAAASQGYGGAGPAALYAPLVAPEAAGLLAGGGEPAGGRLGGERGGRWPALRPLGQIAATYIVAEGERGLYLIDQHAAHERLNYERFLRLLASGEGAGQALAVPQVLSLRPAEMATWEAHREELARLGFRAEPFGPGSLLLREVPLLWTGAAPGQAFLMLLDRLAAGAGGREAALEVLERVAAVSCKAAVKARDPLTLAEVDRLLAEMARAEDPFTCPHGRPTIVEVSHAELERLFKRA